MGDGAAERRMASGGDRVGVDELPIFGRFGEVADAVLADLDPVGRADRLADLSADIIEAGDGQLWTVLGLRARRWQGRPLRRYGKLISARPEEPRA